MVDQNGRSSSLDVDGGLQKVLYVAPQQFLEHCLMEPLQHPGFSEDLAELWNMLWGLWSCLAWAVFSVCQPIVVYPDCGPVCIWHGQSSVCASPRLWSCLIVC